ncbi:SDR family oxidoreductase [Kordiimonas sp. SCSIO 12610]|uniref:SDR family NAD(P)-dependent oxidoreductase n=1 Tax=Kordiimonas sp. SCSIO 12610 TaxID=2829597 RepID=UPI002109E1FF|nr:SDR family NAD(P)-dependent oxidoreductase [Kordiimonas sp. SCSIO 12610]UTW54353.1 SDR family NAD(P)-dependent oxidoreductase [Kordiimonas sp. SCSIO 12610]
MTRQRVIWITGASSGIGEALALEYTRRGNIVYGSARSADKLNDVRERSKSAKGTFHPVTADVCDLDALKRAYQSIQAQSGTPDLVILNAGTHKPTSALEFSLADHRSLIEINYMGVLNCMDIILPSFLERRSGQIAIVSSVAGYRGLPKASGYGASKAALINFCESIREELKSQNVDLRMVNPGFVKTPLTDLNEFPMPFLMPVDDAVRAMIKGLESKKFEITFPATFAFLMKLLRRLPTFIHMAITRKIVGS